MLLYAAMQLETDKLYYLFRSCLNTEDVPSLEEFDEGGLAAAGLDGL